MPILIAHLDHLAHLEDFERFDERRGHQLLQATNMRRASARLTATLRRPH
jgi:hypothetical protein